MKQPKTARQAAITLAKTMLAMSRQGVRTNNKNIELELGYNYSVLSLKKGSYPEGLRLLKEKEMIKNIPAIGYKLMRPIEEIENELMKWSSARKTKTDSNIKVIHREHREHAEHPKEKPEKSIESAKKIVMQINNVTLTIEF